MHISNNHLEKDVVILPDLWEVTFFYVHDYLSCQNAFVKKFCNETHCCFCADIYCLCNIIEKSFFFNITITKMVFVWKKSFSEYQTLSSYVMTTYNATLEGKLFFFLFLLRFHEKLISLIWDDGQTRRMTYMIFMRELVSVVNSTKQLI